jgi:hypothetical protein
LVHTQPRTSRVPVPYVFTNDTSGQKDTTFQEEFFALKMLASSLQVPILFISFEPAETNKVQHYVFGVLDVNSQRLMIVNPTGETTHQEFYDQLKVIKEKYSLEIALSTTAIQHHEKPISSCGPLCVELMRHFMNINIQELHEFIRDTGKPAVKQGLRYQSFSLASSSYLPESLLGLDEEKNEDYRQHVLNIRQKIHLTLLREIYPTLSGQERQQRLEESLNTTQENIVKRFMFKELSPLQLEEDPSYLKLKNALLKRKDRLFDRGYSPPRKLSNLPLALGRAERGKVTPSLDEVPRREALIRQKAPDIEYTSSLVSLNSSSSSSLAAGSSPPRAALFSTRQAEERVKEGSQANHGSHREKEGLAEDARAVYQDPEGMTASSDSSSYPIGVENMRSDRKVLTTHGLKKLSMRNQTPAGEKLRAYELVLDEDPIFNFEIHIPQCGLPYLEQRRGLSAEQRNAQKIKDIQTGLDLEKEKGRVIAPKANVEDLRNKDYILVKQGNLINIMTRKDYDRIRKQGHLSIGEKSYEGEYDGKPYILNGMGTLTFSNANQTLTGLWKNDGIDQLYKESKCENISHEYNFIGRISFSLENEKSGIIFLDGKFTDRNGNYYEGEYNNALPNGRGKFVIDGVPFEGNVNTTVVDQRNEYTVKVDDQNADDVIFCQNNFGEIQIKERIPKAIPSIGEEFQSVLIRALKLSQYLPAWRQTMIFVFNDTPYIMERSFYKSGWGSYYIDPPRTIFSGQYASFHHMRSSKTGGASQGFFSYHLNCPQSPLQVKCGFDTQVFAKNRFGGELLARCAEGELPNGECGKEILTNQVEKETHEATNHSSGVVMKLGMNNDYTSFFCVRLNRYDPDIVPELKIPKKKAEVDELKENENVNFFFRR